MMAKQGTGFKRNRINRRVINDLKNRSTVGMYFYLAVTLGVLSVDGFYQRHPGFSAVFLAAMVFIAVFRISHFYLYDRFERINYQANFCAFFTSVFATALTWGLGFAYFMVQPEELTSKMVMMASSVGLDSGGVVAFIPSRRTAVTYNLLALMPAVMAMLYLQIHLIIAFLIVLFAAYMTLVAFRGNREYWDALENEYLLKRKNEEIKEISRIDVLTGLYNRRYFSEIFNLQWKTAARNNGSLIVLICDLDFFKEINDTYGHLAGDEYLKQAAGIFLHTFKRDTDLIARYGGEEFVVLLSGMDKERAVSFAERVRQQIRELTVVYSGQQLQTTISIGLSICSPKIGWKSDRLLEQADRALYQAKNQGRNQVVFYETSK